MPNVPHVDTPQSRCNFGIARCDITPPVGIYHRMWGAATHERAAGVHRPLTASAVLFQALAPGDAGALNDPEQVLIALDHCLLWHPEMEPLLDRVAKKSQVPRERLLVVFSHTHSAGLIDGDRKHLPGGELIDPYLAELAEKLGDIVVAAAANVQPATIVYGVGRCSLAANRDFLDPKSGQFVCGFNPEGSADDTLVFARATNDAGQLLATFVNYACHPTTLAWENQLISPDFPGAMREVVEEATGAPCIFLQGASGDLGPCEGYSGDVKLADRNGRQLGYAALSIHEALAPPGTRFQYAGPVVSGATLGLWTHEQLPRAEWEQKGRWRLARWTVELPYRPERPTTDALQAARAGLEANQLRARQTGDTALERDTHALIERIDRQITRLAGLPPGPELALPVWLWSIGDVLWLAVESEHYQTLQRTLRTQFPDRPIVVMTLANGSRPSYLPAAETYGTGAYPETIALLARGSLEKLIENIAERIVGMTNDERTAKPE